MDPAPGNSISVGLNGQTAPVGTVGQLYFQANLSTAIDGDGNIVFANGLGGNFFTIVASFSEKLESRTVDGVTGNTVLNFGAPAATGEGGVFRIYRHGVNGNNLGGTCFVTDCGGTLVLEGTLINDADFDGTFTTNFATGIAPLDQTQLGTDNDYPGISTISGGGSFNANIRVTFAHDSYFPTLLDGASFLFATTQQTLPYTTADPSACFSSNAATTCNYAGAGGAGVGTTNGLGADTMLQTDASLTFGGAEIPEPATMTMLGLGLLGVAAARKLRSRKA
jgi:hypothetical protein